MVDRVIVDQPVLLAMTPVVVLFVLVMWLAHERARLVRLTYRQLRELRDLEEELIVVRGAVTPEAPPAEKPPSRRQVETAVRDLQRWSCELEDPDVHR
jgi:hypothetical protein